MDWNLGHLIDSSACTASTGPIKAYPKIVETWREESLYPKKNISKFQFEIYLGQPAARMLAPVFLIAAVFMAVRSM